MAGGKTYWWAKDAAWLRRENIVELGDRFGPAGPLVIDALCGMAKLENDAGRVFTGYKTLGREAFTDPETVRQIVAMAGALGVLDEVTQYPDGRRFACRISGWVVDQEKGRAADRKAKQRKSRSVTDGHASVGDRTAQDRTEQLDERRSGTRATQPTRLVDNSIVEQPNLTIVEESA